MKRQRTDGDSTPYPNEVEVTTDMSNFNTQYEHLKTGDEKRDVEIRAGGRILNKVDDSLYSNCLHVKPHDCFFANWNLQH